MFWQWLSSQPSVPPTNGDILFIMFSFFWAGVALMVATLYLRAAR
jgi:hypothetical protein